MNNTSLTVFLKNKIIMPLLFGSIDGKAINYGPDVCKVTPSPKYFDEFVFDCVGRFINLKRKYMLARQLPEGEEKDERFFDLEVKFYEVVPLLGVIHGSYRDHFWIQAREFMDDSIKIDVETAKEYLQVLGTRSYSSVDTKGDVITRTGLDSNHHAGPLLALGTGSLGLGFKSTDTGDDIIRTIIKYYPELSEELSKCRSWSLVYYGDDKFGHVPTTD